MSGSHELVEIRTPFDSWGALRARVQGEAHKSEPKRSFGNSPPIYSHDQTALARDLKMGFCPQVPSFNIRGVLVLLLLASSSLFAQKDPSALINPIEKAREQYRRGKFDQALMTLDRLEKATAPTADSRDVRGCIFLEQGKTDDATKEFDAAHALKYEAFAPRIHSADALLRQKKFGDARSEYEKLIELKAPVWPEYARFGVLLCYLAEHDDDRGRRMVEAIPFPSGSPAYYYAQAAWAFAHGKDSEARKWIDSARKVFPADKTGWFERGLFQLGWIKKPALSVDTFS